MGFIPSPFSLPPVLPFVFFAFEWEQQNGKKGVVGDFWKKMAKAIFGQIILFPFAKIYPILDGLRSS